MEITPRNGKQDLEVQVQTALKYFRQVQRTGKELIITEVLK